MCTACKDVILRGLLAPGVYGRPRARSTLRPQTRDIFILISYIGASLIARHDEDDERPWLHFAAAPAGGRRIEIGRREKNLMRLDVQPHRSRGLFRRDRRNRRVFVRSIFVSDR